MKELDIQLQNLATQTLCQLEHEDKMLMLISVNNGEKYTVVLSAFCSNTTKDFLARIPAQNYLLDLAETHMPNLFDEDGEIISKDLENMVVDRVMKTQSDIDPRFREKWIGEFGYFLTDLETKTIHLSNLDLDGYPAKSNRVTITDDFGEFVVEANRIFPKNEESIEVIELGLKVYQGFFEGTY